MLIATEKLDSTKSIKNYYFVSCVCNNCGQEESLYFFKYKHISDHLCPNCECDTLEKK